MEHREGELLDFDETLQIERRPWYKILIIFFAVYLSDFWVQYRPKFARYLLFLQIFPI